MKKAFPLLSFFLLVSASLYSQPNCEAFKYMGDTLRYKACKKTEETKHYYQFSREFQLILDEAIQIDPRFDYPYREKSVAYLKSGDFLSWKKLIDQAVALNPEANLGYRGWCRYQFFRDDKGAIEDIERLDSLVSYDIGHSANGDYHLNVVRALCFKALGQQATAINIIENQLQDKSNFAGIYALLHLGVLYLESGRVQDAISILEEQSRQNEIADAYYYLSLAYKARGETAKQRESIKKSKALYQTGLRISDPYTHPYDKVYLEQIETELQRLAN